MTIGVLHVTLLLRGCRSLKEKRQIVKSLRERVRHRFNVAVAEIDAQDLWQRAELAIVTVAGDGPFVRDVLESAQRFVLANPDAEVARADIELL